MNSAPQKERLQRLEKFLASDPQNNTLLGDAFETALAVGELMKAEIFLSQAMATGADAAGWKFKESNLRIAQKRFDDALHLLRELERESGAHPAITQNLAYIAFCGQRYADSIALLRPLADAATDASLQSLWLRALHHQGLLDEALAWCEQRMAAGTLTPSAIGVASLIQIDGGSLEQARNWADQALRQEPNHMEALVARATVALAERNVPAARSLLAQALERNPQDGRSFSALGFAEMYAMDIDKSLRYFQQAVAFMPNHIGTWHGLGWVCFMNKDLEGARQAFEQALALDRNFGESHGAVAVMQALAGDREGAKESIERATRLDKAGLSARYAEAILSGEAFDSQAMLRLAQRLLGGRKAPMGDGSMADWLPH
ncbi:MAG: tetratricopeptide repeat protein [Burkholderiales bacterium]|nr:tetratricopeptide repeat protein [Burkholderiales bacterium]